MEGEAQTVPSRCARMASVPVGTCRYWGAVTMSSIVRTSDAVSRWGQRVRTGRLIGKRPRVLQPLPGMEPTRRQAQESQQRLHRHTRTGPIHGPQDPDLDAGAST